MNRGIAINIMVSGLERITSLLKENSRTILHRQNRDVIFLLEQRRDIVAVIEKDIR
jgi:hypothetical protein